MNIENSMENIFFGSCKIQKIISLRNIVVGMVDVNETEK